MTRAALGKTYSLDGAPPIPPRTYSQRGPTTNGHVPSAGSLYHRPAMKKYRLEQFQFLKLLGKGSFGKVLYIHMCREDTFYYMA